MASEGSIPSRIICSYSDSLNNPSSSNTIGQAIDQETRTFLKAQKLKIFLNLSKEEISWYVKRVNNIISDSVTYNWQKLTKDDVLDLVNKDIYNYYTQWWIEHGDVTKEIVDIVKVLDETIPWERIGTYDKETNLFDNADERQIWETKKQSGSFFKDSSSLLSFLKEFNSSKGNWLWMLSRVSKKIYDSYNIIWFIDNPKAAERIKNDIAGVITPTTQLNKWLSFLGQNFINKPFIQFLWEFSGIAYAWLSTWVARAIWNNVYHQPKSVVEYYADIIGIDKERILWYAHIASSSNNSMPSLIKQLAEKLTPLRNTIKDIKKAVWDTSEVAEAMISSAKSWWVWGATSALIDGNVKLMAINQALYWLVDPNNPNQLIEIHQQSKIDWTEQEFVSMLQQRFSDALFSITGKYDERWLENFVGTVPSNIEKTMIAMSSAPFWTTVIKSIIKDITQQRVYRWMIQDIANTKWFWDWSDVPINDRFDADFNPWEFVFAHKEYNVGITLLFSRLLQIMKWGYLVNLTYENKTLRELWKSEEAFLMYSLSYLKNGVVLNPFALSLQNLAIGLWGAGVNKESSDELLYSVLKPFAANIRNKFWLQIALWNSAKEWDINVWLDTFKNIIWWWVSYQDGIRNWLDALWNEAPRDGNEVIRNMFPDIPNRQTIKDQFNYYDERIKQIWFVWFLLWWIFKASKDFPDKAILSLPVREETKNLILDWNTKTPSEFFTLDDYRVAYDAMTKIDTYNRYFKWEKLNSTYWEVPSSDWLYQLLNAVKDSISPELYKAYQQSISWLNQEQDMSKWLEMLSLDIKDPKVKSGIVSVLMQTEVAWLVTYYKWLYNWYNTWKSSDIEASIRTRAEVETVKKYESLLFKPNKKSGDTSDTYDYDILKEIFVHQLEKRLPDDYKKEVWKLSTSWQWAPWEMHYNLMFKILGATKIYDESLWNTFADKYNRTIDWDSIKKANYDEWVMQTVFKDAVWWLDKALWYIDSSIYYTDDEKLAIKTKFATQWINNMRSAWITSALEENVWWEAVQQAYHLLYGLSMDIKDESMDITSKELLEKNGAKNIPTSNSFNWDKSYSNYYKNRQAYNNYTYAFTSSLPVYLKQFKINGITDFSYKPTYNNGIKNPYWNYSAREWEFLKWKSEFNSAYWERRRPDITRATSTDITWYTYNVDWKREPWDRPQWRAFTQRQWKAKASRKADLIIQWKSLSMGWTSVRSRKSIGRTITPEASTVKGDWWELAPSMIRWRRNVLSVERSYRERTNRRQKRKSNTRQRGEGSSS